VRSIDTDKIKYLNQNDDERELEIQPNIQGGPKK